MAYGLWGADSHKTGIVVWLCYCMLCKHLVQSFYLGKLLSTELKEGLKNQNGYS